MKALQASCQSQYGGYAHMHLFPARRAAEIKAMSSSRISTRPGFCQLEIAGLQQCPGFNLFRMAISKFIFLRRILVLFPITPIRMIYCWKDDAVSFFWLCWREHPSQPPPFPMDIETLLPVALRSQVKSIDKLLSPPPSLSSALSVLVNINGGLSRKDEVHMPPQEQEQ